MATRARARRNRRDWSLDHLAFLAYGFPLGGSLPEWEPFEVIGQSEREIEIPSDVIGDMREAWQALRERIHEEGWVAAGHRPWGWWMFSAPERRSTEEEYIQLRRLGVLSADEERQLGVWYGPPEPGEIDEETESLDDDSLEEESRPEPFLEN